MFSKDGAIPRNLEHFLYSMLPYFNVRKEIEYSSDVIQATKVTRVEIW